MCGQKTFCRASLPLPGASRERAWRLVPWEMVRRVQQKVARLSVPEGSSCDLLGSLAARAPLPGSQAQGNSFSSDQLCPFGDKSWSLVFCSFL